MNDKQHIAVIDSNMEDIAGNYELVIFFHTNNSAVEIGVMTEGQFGLFQL